MKKILLSVLVAGCVTVASAEQLNCTNNYSTQCCVDYNTMNVDIINNGYIVTSDLYFVNNISGNVLSNPDDCQSRFNWHKENAGGNAIFDWKPGNWASTIKYLSN